MLAADRSIYANERQFVRDQIALALIGFVHDVSPVLKCNGK